VLHALDHVIVAVRDLEAATASTALLLGRGPSWRGEHPGQGTRNTLFRLANAYLELIHVAGDGPFARLVAERAGTEGEGLVGLAFGTDDADECARELRAAGVAAAEPVEGSGVDLETGAKRTWRNVLWPANATRGVLAFAIEHLSPPDALPPAPLVAPRESAFEALDHVVIRSPDADAAQKLYRESLRVRLALDKSFPERGVRLQFFRLGGVTIEIASLLAAAPDPAAPDRLWGLAWRVPDADAARARLVAAGFDVTPVRSGNKPGTRVCTVQRDTCGVPTLVIAPD